MRAKVFLEQLDEKALGSPEAKVAERKSMISKMLRPDYLGQTLASLCWIFSVFIYGFSGWGDWLQLAAASFWLFANMWVLKIDD